MDDAYRDFLDNSAKRKELQGLLLEAGLIKKIHLFNIDALIEPKWDNVQEKPSTFPPSDHEHDNYFSMDGSPIDDEYAKFTIHGLIGRTYAEVLEDLSGEADAAFDWNGQDLSRIGYIDFDEIADPGAPAASDVRLFAINSHIVSIDEDDVWHDLSAGAKGVSSCVHETITVTDADGLNITWSAGKIFDANITGGDQIINIAAQPANQGCTASSLNYLFFDRSAGVLVLNTAGPDYTDGDFSVAHIFTTHDDILDIFYRPICHQSLYKIKHVLRAAFPVVVASGLVISEHASGGAFDVDQSAGSFTYRGFEVIVGSLLASTTANVLYRWFHNASNEWEVDTNTQIDADNYDDVDDSSGIIGNTDGSYYRSAFYTCGNHIHWVYPQQGYANLNLALKGVDPTPPSALEKLPKTTVLILKGDAAALPAVGSDQWIDARPVLGVSSGGATITDHGLLGGLTDDDHTQYILHSLAAAANDFLVASGNDVIVKKTLAQTGEILEADINHDNLVGFVAGEHFLAEDENNILAGEAFS